VDVLANDKLNGVILTPADVWTISNKKQGHLSNTDGTVSVDPNTPVEHTLYNTRSVRLKP
jgi:hypothetical protein